MVGSFASRSGMTTGGKPDGLASASSTMPNGCFSVSLNVFASITAHSAPAARMAPPKVSRDAQRWIDATASAGVTGLPSENFRPGRSVKVHCNWSFDVVYLSTICGWGRPLASCANSVSYTI